MNPILHHLLRPHSRLPPWDNPEPVREELFGLERLEQHAESLAAAQELSSSPPAVLPLQARLDENATVLLEAYRASAREIESGRTVTPAAEWLLDNYHIIEEQIREIRDDLPPSYYRQLPKLASGPFAGYPRVFGLAWAFVAHSDSHLDPETLRRFVTAYQRVQPLTIGELWATAITLRIVLVENLRRLCDQITQGQIERAEANELADHLLAPESARAPLSDEIMRRSSADFSEIFAAQLAKRLRDQDPRTTPALAWFEERLRLQSLSIEAVVQHAQQRQGASNVSMRNVITSMRLISDIHWAELFESVSLVDERLCSASNFALMDFPTRNMYRSAIETLARGSTATELEITERVIQACALAATRSPERPGDNVETEPGYHLIGAGRPALEHAIGFVPTWHLRVRRRIIGVGITGYVAAIVGLSLAVVALGVDMLYGAGLGLDGLLIAVLAGLLPASALATSLINRAVTLAIGPLHLPGLELKSGVPKPLRTLVVIPTLLTNKADLLEQIGQLEVHYLAGPGGDIAFALLCDWADADREILEEDADLTVIATSRIRELNERYGPSPTGQRFYFLNRRRLFNPGENKWMGWERKRGKLHELNRLLRGATDTSFIVPAATAGGLPTDVRYIITLDADTRLPRDAAIRLIGKMAHPLNQPRFHRSGRRIESGYAILQPRITPSLPTALDGSLYQRLTSEPGGIDPYAAAISDVYQDLFGEGSYTGKGIYDVDAFESALLHRIPENALLSHDLFEGVFARSGLASDTELVEEFPGRYDVVAKRAHRWVRGDWQLLPWVFGPLSGPLAVPAVGRWKMVDNLRRSLVAPSTILAFAITWLLAYDLAETALALLLLGGIAGALLPPIAGLIRPHTARNLGTHLSGLALDLRRAALHALIGLTFLADHACRNCDAIARTLVRLLVTHRHLLEWTTTAQSSHGPRPDLRAYYRDMSAGVVVSLVLFAGTIYFAPWIWPLELPFTLLWLAAPALAYWTSQPPHLAESFEISTDQARELRLIGRSTWRYFETFVTPAENMLPPDNFQEDPKGQIAHRTSPTNIGLYLLACVAARDFSWVGTVQLVERLEATLATLDKLQRYNGHFLNWYATDDLHPLTPAYVSSVDSGNFAGHLIALANACDQWCESLPAPNLSAGARDIVALAHQAILNMAAGVALQWRHIVPTLEEIDYQFSLLTPGLQIPAQVQRLVDSVALAIQQARPEAHSTQSLDLAYWTGALTDLIAQSERDRGEMAAAPDALRERLRAIAQKSRTFAVEMDFSFLLDADRKLLSIGYSLVDKRLDPSCYDLLASESRLASLIAIAKGDAPTRHWFRLGRSSTPLQGSAALISWSGSMFEYLMPSLVMRAPEGSLLAQTNRLVVAYQQSYGRAIGIPWGVSESAYNARNLELTYQYSNFGVPGLGLKRGLAGNVVIAPYATALATMVDPRGALLNFRRLAEMGARGSFGFYEALDFTRSRLPEDEDYAIIRVYMAHHQGMTIVALANTLRDGQMRMRFHREAMIRATDLLLQERTPHDVAIAHPRAEEVQDSESGARSDTPAVRHLLADAPGAPVTHLLSNGRYAVMLTATGAGYSRWKDIAVTRWREDATLDNWGSFVFARDTHSGQTWCASAHPFGNPAEGAEAIFGEDHAQFVRHHPGLTTTVDILVSGEDDGEVRRVSLVNTGRRAQEIELTSFAELVLTTAAADAMHPAFGKMFVQTEHLAEYDALIATRRLRSADEAQIWAAHFAIVEGELGAAPQFETDRARFIGRGRTIGSPLAMDPGQTLSNTVGVVLDPIFSVRRCVIVPSGSVVRISFWTLLAASRDELLELIGKHHDRSAYERAKTLAWTQAQVQLRHLDVTIEEAADFQRLAAPLLYADARFRAPSQSIIRGAGPQSGLWPHGVSGDLPIVVLRIDEVEDLACVRQLLRAHEYWRLKRLGVDLVIVNERGASYTQELQIAIETAVRSSQSRPRLGAEQPQGSVYALRADLMTVEVRALLRSVARVVLDARRGSIGEQLSRLDMTTIRTPYRIPPAPSLVAHLQSPANLEFFNGTGGFDKNGREYVTVLDQGATTPAPWINVITNPSFGFQVSADGSGHTWAENSHENQLTHWSNDPVSDPSGDVFYIRDETSGRFWSATAQPIRDSGTYIVRHGFGYSRFEHEANDIASELCQYVPLDDPIKISRLRLRNLSDRKRRLSVTNYLEWVLGTSRSASGPFIITQIDETTGAMLARNPWSMAFPGRIAFADLRGQQQRWTADRGEFLGRNGSLAAPAALLNPVALSGTTGAGFDPCAALQCIVELEAGQSIEVVALLGQCASIADAQALITRYREADLEAALDAVSKHWTELLGQVQVKTPERSMDIMLNGWLLYQTLACRIWARTAFYQASGAYGFRDQLQDTLALSFALPQETRRHLLRAASRQFVEGDFQHWWLPHSGQGVRTRISDDRVWLAFAAATYLDTSGDESVLDEQVPFLEGPPLSPGQDDSFFQPMIAAESASLFEHCARGIDQCIGLTGEHGLPLMGTGDWNDGMNHVGAHGKGESVWLAWLLVRTIDLLDPWTTKHDPVRAERWRHHARSVRDALETHAWDGEWYRRATYDDGTWLGSSTSDECRLDSIAQTWAVLCGGNAEQHAKQAMAAVNRLLVRRDAALIELFSPPFDKTSHDPGYIKGYPPGVRENGGQYTHAATWAVLAFAKQRDGDTSTELFGLLNPINHARTPAQLARYKVEPYVIAADIYSVPPHVGRGGWTWYTGSAGWMYRAGIEGILGIRRQGGFLVLDPCIPSSWDGFEATVRIKDTQWHIRIEAHPPDAASGWTVSLDGTALASDAAGTRLALDGGTHEVLLRIAAVLTSADEIAPAA